MRADWEQKRPSAGELLNFHPHVHVLVMDGGFLPDGTFRPLAWFDSLHVERLFHAEVLRMLLGKELIGEATAQTDGICYFLQQLAAAVEKLAP